MDNKYQEALDILRNIEQSHNYKKIGSSLAPESDTLQELVDKATPKKPIKENFEDDRYNNCYKYSCPTCGDRWVCDIPNYCLECGQALNRSKENNE